jgi:hypothetical protein
VKFIGYCSFREGALQLPVANDAPGADNIGHYVYTEFVWGGGHWGKPV